MDYIAQPKDYWMAPRAIEINLNALGNPNRTQCSVASGAVIMCYIKGIEGLEYDNGHQYRAWSISAAPTYFNTATHKYIYVAIPRSADMGVQAIVVYPSEKLDIYGVNEDNEQIGSEDYYYIWLQALISESAGGGTGKRSMLTEINYGLLSTDEARDDQSYNTDWYSFNAVTQTVTFLKDIFMKAGSNFRNLILGGKELTGVATGETSDEYVDSEVLVVTPSYLNAKYNNRYIRKDQDDSTPFNLGVDKDLHVGGDAAVGGVLRANEIQSDNFTGDGIVDTGFRLTMRDQTGNSKLTVDNLYVRKKATFEELEVRKETAIAGNQIYSSAANVVLRTDYFDANGELMGYSMLQVPWMLKKVPFLLRMLSRESKTGFFGRIRKTRLFLDAEDIPKIRRVRCYFLAKDDEREIKNLWRVEEYYPDDYPDVSKRGQLIPGTGNDLARCQTMNLENSTRSTYIHGMESKLGNVYWWRKLCGVSTTPIKGDDGREYHYIDVMFDYEAEEEYRENGQLCPWCDLASGDIPAAGDHVVQFGNDMNPDRMNLIAVEVNSSADAPAHKWYRGIYTFDLTRCWWGGNPRKDMISAASGVEFFGPSFKVVTEYGVAKVPKDREEVNWSDIAQQRDDYNSHTSVRKCYNYDSITHAGSRWLCLIPEGVHWVCPQVFDDPDYAIFDTNGTYLHNGNYISDIAYYALTQDQKSQCGRIPNYTTKEPGTDNAVWKKIVAKGDQGIRGDFKSTVFVRTNTAPDTPTGGSYDDPVPEGWNDGIPDGEEIVWASECTFYGAGGSSGWSTPKQMTDTTDFDVEYSSVASPNPPTGHPNTNTQWSNTADSNTIWMATSEKHNGVWSDWQVQKIKGEKGDTGTRGDFKSTVFKRTNTTPGTPSGGSYTNPVPSGWSDGIPDGEEIVWASACTFYGAGGSSGWSTPRQMTDTTDFDVEYSSVVSPNPPTGHPNTNTQWSNTADSNTIWMATSEKHNGVWSSWQVSKIKGEKGQDGQNGQDGYTPVKGVDYFDGQNGKDGWMVTANPANVIITQNLDTQSSFTSATVTFSAKKGNVSATISSIGTPSSSTFNVSKSGNSVVVSSPQSSGGSYYSEGNFEVAVYVTDPDTGSTIGFNITVFCYANLLGTWKQSVEAGEENIAASKILYTLGASGDTLDKIKTDYTSKRNSVGSYETWSSASESTDGSKANMIKKTTTAQSTADGVSTKVNAVTTTSGGTTHVKESEVTQYADKITMSVTDGLKATGIDITAGQILLQGGVVEIEESVSVPTVISNSDTMKTLIEAGNLEIRSKTTQSYGVFRINTDGEIVLSMFDKNGNKVIDIGGTPETHINGEWVTWKLCKKDAGHTNDGKTYYAVTESQCTTYYQLKLGQVVNSGYTIEYFLPPTTSSSIGSQTIDQGVIARDNCIFTSKASAASASSLETAIKALTFILPDGYYIIPNNGRFEVEANLYGPTNYKIDLYHISSGKIDNILTQRFAL